MYESSRMQTLIPGMAPLAPLPQLPEPADATSIGEQAQEIIDSILEDTSPGLAGVKLRLRRYVAAHPSHPEKALLAHLMETSTQVNSEDYDGQP